MAKNSETASGENGATSNCECGEKEEEKLCEKWNFVPSPKSKHSRLVACERYTAIGKLLCNTTFCLQINFKRIRWNMLRRNRCESVEICITQCAQRSHRCESKWLQWCFRCTHFFPRRLGTQWTGVFGRAEKSHKGKMKKWNKRALGDACNKVRRDERAEENEIINVGGKWRNGRRHRHVFGSSCFAYTANSEH